MRPRWVKAGGYRGLWHSGHLGLGFGRLREWLESEGRGPTARLKAAVFAPELVRF